MHTLPIRRDGREDKHMADPIPHSDNDSDTGDTGMPRWVKVFGLVALVLVLLFVILMLTGHSPGRHMP